MNWIFLSPHLDDVALSCAGLVWELSQAGAAAQVWTICAGSPPEGDLSPFARTLHTRWETGDRAAELRREEDRISCQRMGAVCRQFSILDCIYRRAPGGEYLYTTEESLFDRLDPREEGLIRDLSAELLHNLPEEAQIVCPLSIGGHVDHQLTRRAAEALQTPLLYYADYPYILKAGNILDGLKLAGWTSQVFPVSGQGMKAWEEAVAAYRSQISTFWRGDQEMRVALQAFCESMDGVRLWKQASLSGILHFN